MAAVQKTIRKENDWWCGENKRQYLGKMAYRLGLMIKSKMRKIREKGVVQKGIPDYRKVILLHVHRSWCFGNANHLV